MLQRHPNPKQALRGRTVERPPTNPQAVPASTPPRRSNQSDLTAMLPEFETLQCGEEVLIVPESVVQPAGMAAWYRLGRIRPGELGKELLFNSAEVTLGSCDPAGTGAGFDPALAGFVMPWGDKMGRGAALVIGEQLPLADGLSNLWSFAPFIHPGFNEIDQDDTGTVRFGLRNSGRGVFESPYLLTVAPPIGQLTDSQPYKWSVPKQYGALGRRISSSSSLDVALVFKQGTLNQLPPTDDRFILIHAFVQLFCVPSRARGQLNED